MAVVLRIWAVLVLAVKRLLAQRRLALASLLGVTSAAVLVMSIPLYVDAVYCRLLREELTGTLIGEQRPPFSFIFHSIGATGRPLQLEEVQRADRYLSEPVLSDLGLPQQLRVRSLKTDRFGLFPGDTTTYTNPLARLMTIRFGWISGLEEHITVSEGSFPITASNTPLEVLLSEAVAGRTGLQIGETLVAFASRESKNIQIPVRISGIWRAADPKEAFWFRDPASFDEVLLVSEETFLGPLSAQVDNQVTEALWYFVADGRDIRTSDVGPLIVRIMRVQAIVSSLLPRAIVTSPLEALQRYYWAVRSLTIQLYTFCIPIIGLNLVFISLVTGMSVQGRRGETAVLRSRGASSAQVVGVAAFEGLIIGLFAVALALPGSLVTALIATRVRTFMNLTAQSDLPVAWNESTLWVGLAAIGFAVVMHILPTIGVVSHTIVTYKQEQARMLRAPLWQRMGWDLLLLIPAGYGAYLLKQQGSLFLPVDGLVSGDPFRNPLLVLVPSLTVLALTLLLIRVLPLIMKGLAWLVSQTRSVSFLLAVRHLSRTPSLYTAPMVLLIMTLSLSVFLSSTAQTLDEHLYDQGRYRIGADMVLMPQVDTKETEENRGGTTHPANGVPAPIGVEVSGWFYVPLSDYLGVPGVQHAARVDRYTASLGQAAFERGTLMAVDRAGFSQVAFWRQDFAPENLGALMNRLGTTGNGVLLPRGLMDKHALRVGDSIRIVAEIYGQETEFILSVVGSFELFPTWSPRWGPLFVINLDYLSETVGADLPASVWLELDPAADSEQVKAALYQLNPYSGIQCPFYAGIAAEYRQPERQGLLGILSMGFASAALLATVGFLLYTLFSFQRRSIALGILRSMGLSSWQMSRYLAWESVFLVLIGLASGTGLGILISQQWIPYYRIGTDTFARILPMPVRYSWSAILDVYALFGLFLTVVLGLSIAFSRKLKLSEVVKIAETA